MTRLLRITLLSLLLIGLVLTGLIYSLTWRPLPKETLTVSCSAQATPLVPGQALKVMTWNLQYLAGKRYVFWNDQARGEDERPTLEDMAFSLDEVARVIRDEQPDVVLLQELDDGAKASDYQDQLKLLQAGLLQHIAVHFANRPVIGVTPRMLWQHIQLQLILQLAAADTISKTQQQHLLRL